MLKKIQNKKNAAMSIMIAAFIMAIIRIFVITYGTDIESIEGYYYFLTGSVTTALFAAGTILILLIGVVVGSRISKGTIYSEKSLHPFSVFIVILTGFVLFIGTVYLLIEGDDNALASKLEIIMHVFALLSAVFFLYQTSNKTRFGVSIYYLLSFSPIIYFAFRILTSYIKYSTIQSSSSLPYYMLSVIFFLLFFLSDARLRIRKEGMGRFFAFGFAAILASLIYNIPALILPFIWTVPSDGSILQSTIDIVFSIYVSNRLLMQLKDIKENQKSL